MVTDEATERQPELEAGDPDAVPARGPGDLEVAAELVERARAEGVSLVGPDGLLSGLTKQVLERVA